MNSIQFNEDQQYGRPSFNSEKRSWLSGLVIKTGLAKDNAGAQKVLLIVLVLAVIGIVVVWWPSSTPSTSSSAPTTPLRARPL